MTTLDGGPTRWERTAAQARAWLAMGIQPYLRRRISEQTASGHSLDRQVEFVFDFRLSFGPHQLGMEFGLRPIQVQSEILELLHLLKAERPRRVLEIGSAGGGTLFLFARVAAPDAHIVGLDLPPSPASIGVPDWRVSLYESTFGSPGQTVKVVRGDSHAPATIARVRDSFGGEQIDFLFVDGDHSYEGVRRDFTVYSQFVRPRGLVAFHDIVPDYTSRSTGRVGVNTGGVPQFWSELKGKYSNTTKVVEIIKDAAQDGFGIGVLQI